MLDGLSEDRAGEDTEVWEKRREMARLLFVCLKKNKTSNQLPSPKRDAAAAEGATRHTPAGKSPKKIRRKSIVIRS